MYITESIGNIKVIISKNYALLSKISLKLLIDEIKEFINSKGNAVLVLTAGQTPVKLYNMLSTEHKNTIDWTKVVLFQMDEYLGINLSRPQSFTNFLLKEVVKPLKIQEVHLLSDYFDKAEKDLRHYEEKIYQNRGIDIIVHGIGQNGHLGFNEPNSSFDSRTRVVNLTESTRKANSKYFNSVEDVPKKGITIGLKTIFEAKKHFLLASGHNKMFAVISSLLGPVTERIPASVLQLHENVTFIIDKEACDLSQNVGYIS